MTGSRSKTVRLVEIAELLGVTKQRAHQIAQEKGSPAPLAEDTRGSRCRRGRSGGAARSLGAVSGRPSAMANTWPTTDDATMISPTLPSP